MGVTVQSLAAVQTARYTNETLDRGSGFVWEMTATLAFPHRDWTFQF
jgi:hypothetical protein